MKLIIVRHGETEENKRKIVQGHMPGRLSRKGKVQVKKLSKRLCKEHLDIIYCSDLKRAKDTCKAIIRHHPKTPVKYVKELRERAFGRFEGKTEAEMHEYLNKNKITLARFKPKGGESRLEKNRRVIRFLKKTLKKHPDDTVLWITHSGVNSAALNTIFNLEGDHRKLLYSLNTSFSMIEFDGKGKHKVHVVNCVKHLL